MTAKGKALSADWNKVLQMAPLEIQVSPGDKSGDSSCDGDTDARELEAIKAAVLRFGRAEKTTRFGTTFFTGEIPENKVGGRERSLCFSVHKDKFHLGRMSHKMNSLLTVDEIRSF